MKKSNLIYLALLILLACLSIYAYINKFYIDDMKNKDVYNIKYKTYNNKNEWLHFTGNGVTNGTTNSISNIKFKLKDKDYFSYDLYTEKEKWTNDISIGDKYTNNSNIRGIRMFTYKNIRYKYDICYRTYNKKDKWLGWTCNGSINGNANEDIYMIQVKIIPKKAVVEEYLEDYNNSDINNKNF